VNYDLSAHWLSETHYSILGKQIKSRFLVFPIDRSSEVPEQVHERRMLGLSLR